MIPPPTLSEIGPAPVRASDPTRGPRNAYVSGSGAPGKLPYSVLMRSERRRKTGERAEGHHVGDRAEPRMFVLEDIELLFE
jgi:hypothetical protein